MVSVAPIITDAGKSFQIRAIGGETIVFTKFKIGDGDVPVGTEWSSLTDLISEQLDFGISEIDVSNSDFVKVTGLFNNSQITETFRWKELGLFCRGSKIEKFSGDGETDEFVLTDIPDSVVKVEVGGTIATITSYDPETGTLTLASAPASGTDNITVTYPYGDEVLYAYSNDGSDAGILKADVTDVVIEQTVMVIIATGDAENVTAIISASAMYALKSDFDSHTGNNSNPHHVTKTQVGLGEVPNVSTNNQTPTYSIAQQLVNMISGETLAVAFGKIAKAISSFISHLSNKANPHSVTLSQVLGGGSSGVIPIANGGTGQTSVDITPTSGSDKMVTSGGVYSALAGKSPTGHNHDDRYYTEQEVNNLLSGKAPSSHNHDDRYYTESEMDTKLGGKANSSHNHNASNINAGTLPVARGGTGQSSVDSTPTSGSQRMVTSGGVYNALSGKANSNHSHSASDINGTLAVEQGGTGKNSLESYSDSNQYRGIIFSNSIPTSIPSGCIVLVYY